MESPPSPAEAHAHYDCVLHGSTEYGITEYSNAVKTCCTVDCSCIEKLLRSFCAQGPGFSIIYNAKVL